MTLSARVGAEFRQECQPIIFHFPPTWCVVGVLVVLADRHPFLPGGAVVVSRNVSPPRRTGAGRDHHGHRDQRVLRATLEADQGPV